jgi:hypothetical protein
MARRLVFLVVFVTIAIAGLAARAADPLETFLRHSENPAQFTAADLDPAYRAEFTDGVNHRNFSREQTIAQAMQAKSAITDHRLKSLKILGRQTNGHVTRVTYQARSEIRVQGRSIDILYRVRGMLRPGGPNGFVWLNQAIEQLPNGTPS